MAIFNSYFDITRGCQIYYHDALPIESQQGMSMNEDEQFEAIKQARHGASTSGRQVQVNISGEDPHIQRIQKGLAVPSLFFAM